MVTLPQQKGVGGLAPVSVAQGLGGLDEVADVLKIKYWGVGSNVHTLKKKALSHNLRGTAKDSVMTAG